MMIRQTFKWLILGITIELGTENGVPLHLILQSCRNTSIPKKKQKQKQNNNT